MLTSEQIANTAQALAESAVYDLEKIAVQLALHVGGVNALRIANVLAAVAEREQGSTAAKVKVRVEDAGRAKIMVCKKVREWTGLPLKEAKAVADGAASIEFDDLARLARFMGEMQALGAKVVKE